METKMEAKENKIDFTELAKKVLADNPWDYLKKTGIFYVHEVTKATANLVTAWMEDGKPHMGYEFEFEFEVESGTITCRLDLVSDLGGLEYEFGSWKTELACGLSEQFENINDCARLVDMIMHRYISKPEIKLNF